MDEREKRARGWGLNLDSEVARTVIDNSTMTVGEFIAHFRQAQVRRYFPAEYLTRTLEEAFESRDPRVRRLLLDSRWVKR